jgi:hypothetical protein
MLGRASTQPNRVPSMMYVEWCVRLAVYVCPKQRDPPFHFPHDPFFVGADSVQPLSASMSNGSDQSVASSLTLASNSVWLVGKLLNNAGQQLGTPWQAQMMFDSRWARRDFVDEQLQLDFVAPQIKANKLLGIQDIKEATIEWHVVEQSPVTRAANPFQVGSQATWDPWYPKFLKGTLGLSISGC